MTEWTPPRDWMTINTLDGHTAGEPLRLITGGLPQIPGKSILEKRRYFKQNYDYIRTGLMWEPRGHADMYGAVMTEPVTADGDFGVFFLHNEGYSTMCGHAVIALATMTLDTGMIKKDGAHPVLKMDTPAGRVTAAAHRVDGRVKEVSFVNVPSFVFVSNRRIKVPDLGMVKYDVAFGGAFYAFCDAGALGLKLDSRHYQALIDAGRRIKYAVMDEMEINHPFEKDLGFLYGTIIVGPPENPAHHSRNVCIFAEGEVDRSPTGTGVSARAAIHFARGEIDLGETIVIESILGTNFKVRVIGKTKFGTHPAVIPEVSGKASITGKSTFYFDPDDSLKKGFVFR